MGAEEALVLPPIHRQPLTPLPLVAVEGEVLIIICEETQEWKPNFRVCSSSIDLPGAFLGRQGVFEGGGKGLIFHRCSLDELSPERKLSPARTRCFKTNCIKSVIGKGISCQFVKGTVSVKSAVNVYGLWVTTRNSQGDEFIAFERLKFCSH
ncbi:hypothetical protein CEXT_31311 [Caerostris extrusa]|uniref:Uncharacterized protein n=1 Tax=Caerostris extrusa TaxID=172846 RepID=A0AAV4MZF0_CAEEX|nr:hypothetical protein CEXT_31311 [Caerostris extrusa]